MKKDIPQKQSQEILESITGNTSISRISDQISDESNEEKRRLKIENDGQEDFYKLRKMWSGYIIKLMWGVVLFQCALSFLLGFRLIDLSSYKPFLYAVSGENFLQIIGLGVIVVKFLYKNKKDK